ncbi:MAG TPA: DUF2304 family protein [Candidatus Absconditabacterales bacterium]|nr:DUF2304 family protein [Candidatus Absconditabacterales bacterium]
MSLLQFVVIVAAVVFVLFGLDLYKRKRMNVLHFFVFFAGGGILIVFALNQNLLNQFGSFFGIARGADLLVYIGLIFLAYIYINLFNNHTKDKFQLTRLVSQMAINAGYIENKQQMHARENIHKKDDFVFNIRMYNEGNVVGSVIDEIIAAGFRKLVLVNDGSSDTTLEILEEKKKQYPNILIIILSHTINRGGGAANQTGYNFIKKYGDELKIKRFVGFDADGQMDVKDMEIFIKHIDADQKLGLDLENKKPDLYLGSRFIVGGKVENMPKMRGIIQIFAKLITRILYGTNVSDPHCGYRVISLSALRKIVLTADGMHYANEVNEQIKRYHMKYTEIPVHIRYTDYSMNSSAKGHRNKNSDSIKLAAEMLYKKLFFK